MGQGLHVDEVDDASQPYLLHDSYTGKEVAYASAYAVVQADSIEDLLDLVLRDEFRVIEVISPGQISLTQRELGRLLAQANNRMRGIARTLARETGI